MNNSISADRSPHLKIVAFALLAAIVMAGIVFGLRIGKASAGVMEAGQPLAITSLTIVDY